MFNLKKAKSRVSRESSEVRPEEKMLEKSRKEMDNVADDNPSIHESLLEKDRKKRQTVITDAQMKRPKSEKNEQIVEKKFKRQKLGDLYVPSINAFVEEMIQERRKEFTSRKEQKKGNWTLKPVTQNASLPKWPKNKGQHDKPVLNKYDRNYDEPLIGGTIVKSSVDDAAFAIKTGATQSYDERIVAILKKANDEERELNDNERKAINSIKKVRTAQYLKES